MNTKTVLIPLRAEHCGHFSALVRLNWVCPVCGGERGEIYKTISFDGSLRLSCDGWRNNCGHVDKYSDLINEAVSNGLNDAINDGVKSVPFN